MTERLSIVMPAYNEAAVIEAVVRDLDREIAEPLGDAQIVVVDDCSSDETAEILDRLALENPRVEVHHSSMQRGHGPSVRTAIIRSDGEWIFQVDSDKESLPSEFWELWDKRAERDFLIGNRVERQGSSHRMVLTWLLRRLTFLVSGGHDLRDVNVPFKLFRREVWRDLDGAIPADTVIPSVLLAVGAALRGWRIEQVPTTHTPRVHAPSSLRPVRLARISARALAELLVFRLRLIRMVRLAQPPDPRESRLNDT